MTGALRNRAVRLLARREHSRAELARKLASHGTPEDIEAVLADLEGSGLLSDARYAESFVRVKAPRFSTVRLRHDLLARGVAADAVDAALGQAGDDDLTRAREVWRRKFGHAPADRIDYARQARFLQSRGFSADAIRRVLKDEEE